ncbi:MAG TPA: lysophospholipid acyltransferase family protein [Syntrophales bacterium]|nr:lysophospholipid acyltransferase family protein [Syntrophales bacterium]HOX94423.1 lysophospholipid acyltransferase family protein [Syntrophales bacterium]HPI56816.1 lysophospholipid acyltransferase family protein [Syntrophales bacterium]HPN25746.1 lysophospholipid acyltransferase family protein [Syntrophales bacterium]HQM28711.1 lysophospholipid acyltransferase family protein [Syntrophales bacterium]
MLRSALLVTIGTAVTAFFSVFCVVVYPLLPRREKSIFSIAQLWAMIMLFLTSVKVEVRGRENVSYGRSQIFMSNHQSGFDIFVLLAYTPRYFAWIAKKELFRIPFFGLALRRLGAIEIDRKNVVRAMHSIEDAARIIREGKSVMTFPEGTRSKDGHIQPFKKGVFHLALKSGVPIVPVTLIGTREIMPKTSLRVTPGQVTLIIHPPVWVTDYSEATVEELIAEVRKPIVDAYYAHRPDLRQDRGAAP